MKKVSLYLNEELWVRFKEEVLRRHGTLRKLSNEVESLLRTSLAEEDIVEAFKGMDVDVKALSSPEEVKHDRPKLLGPPSESLIREMRRRRIAEGLPRQ
ncbi:MAG: hypothetical protein QXZ06_05845 [Candidatus Jordarchaeales archaeon]